MSDIPHLQVSSHDNHRNAMKDMADSIGYYFDDLIRARVPQSLAEKIVRDYAYLTLVAQIWTNCDPPALPREVSDA